MRRESSTMPSAGLERRGLAGFPQGPPAIFLISVAQPKQMTTGDPSQSTPG